MDAYKLFNKWGRFKGDALLLESRYTDAVASTTNWKKIMDKERLESVPENYLKNLADTLATSIKDSSKADPTGKNKYLPWLANTLKAYMQKRFKNFATRAAEFDTPEQAALDNQQTLEAIHSNVQYITSKFTRLLPAIHKLEERGLLKLSLIHI